MAERYVDVSHEALIRGWPRLRHWLDQDRAGLRLHRRITEAAEEWQRSGRDDGFLYRARARLTQAQEWRERYESELNALERDFLDQSEVFLQRLENEERERQRRELEAAQQLAETERKRAEQEHRARIRQRYLLIGLVVLLIGIAIVAMIAYEQKWRAERQTAYAEEQKRLAEEQKKKTGEIASQANLSLSRYSEEGGHRAQALAHLARALRLNPENREAVSATTALLLTMNWQWPSCEPMKHGKEVASAQFSPDGQRVVTASWDGTARVWDVPTSTEEDLPEDIHLLAELAEGIGGASFVASGQTEVLSSIAPEAMVAGRKKIVERFGEASAPLTPLQRFLKWIVEDRTTRSISPLSDLTIPEWIENRIKEGDVVGLRKAMQINPAHPRLTAHLGRRLADKALTKDTDPAEARRCRIEADFLTRRALKLDPENEEIKQLRAEVVEMLQRREE